MYRIHCFRTLSRRRVYQLVGLVAVMVYFFGASLELPGLPGTTEASCFVKVNDCNLLSGISSTMVAADTQEVVITPINMGFNGTCGGGGMVVQTVTREFDGAQVGFTSTTNGPTNVDISLTSQDNASYTICVVTKGYDKSNGNAADKCYTHITGVSFISPLGTVVSAGCSNNTTACPF